MTDRLRALDEDALGRALATAARDLDWPSSPDLAARVSATLLDQQRHPSLARPRLSLPRRRRTVLLLVAGLVLLAGCGRGGEGRDRPGRAHDRHDPGAAHGVAARS